jgi:AcrR family transcriptional regulator
VSAAFIDETVAQKRSAHFGTVVGMPDPTSTRPARKDAVRNRARLVDAAASAFREQGLDVSVNAIARDAGVNVATLYRHFPTKDHLVVAVLETVLEPLAAARDHALATADTGDTMAAFVRQAVRLQDDHVGLVDVLGRPSFGTDVRERLRVLAIGIADPIVERAHRDGELREDFDAEDLLIALRMLAAASPGVGKKEADRYIDVVLRGLRPGL